MTVHLRDVVAFLDTTLEVDRFKDYAPNGLQVEGAPEVDTVVCGVSANAALIERAIELRADLIVVHHGIVWGPGLSRIVGPVAKRLALLLGNAISLCAYHLPLDKHARLGNNVGLADAIGLGLGSREWFGDVKGVALGLAGSWNAPVTRGEAIARVTQGVLGERAAPFVFPHGPDVVRKVGVCTGAASDLLESASAAGCDVYVTGELAERAGELARELQITLIAAGHHATEVFGPQRIVDELRMRFPSLTVHFVDVRSPL
jgi:dinuclear metal center YbgI/SA1388 family protein